MMLPNLFDSFLQGGFECSTQRRKNGRRLDLIAATHHDRFAATDYRLLTEVGVRTVRDGLRWHLIEQPNGDYDWSSFLPMLRAAQLAGTQVIWDLCHYGWPDHIDIWSPAFVDRFAKFAAATAQIVRDESDEIPFYSPVNEISYWSWASADAGKFHPLAKGRAAELKRQLVRAAIAAIYAIRSVDPRARIVHADPLVNVLPVSHRARDREAAANYHVAQYEARDMIAGLLAPELGGQMDYLDIVGVNYYSNNQWVLNRGTVEFGHHDYRPLRELLTETYLRYRRPMFIAETGAENTARTAWLYYVCDEVRTAMTDGVPIEGICLYPILEYPGWENARVCQVGLFCMADAQGHRRLYEPLADEISRQQAIFDEMFSAGRRRARTAVG